MVRKIFKIILFVLLFCLLLFLINFAYKFVWYNRLIKAKDDLIATNNFTEVVKMAGRSYNDETGKYEVTYSNMGSQIKDGKKVDLIYDENYEEVIGKIFYISETEEVIVNESKKTFSYTIIPTVEAFARIELTNYPMHSMESSILEKLTLKEKMTYFFNKILSITRKNISFVTENEKDYIVLSDESSKTYFDRETLLASKVLLKKSDWAEEGEEYYVNEYFEYEQGKVTNEDVNLPDLKDYKQEVFGW